MEKPMIIEVYADNGDLSHYALIDTNTGEKLWSEAPEECKAIGYPVKQVKLPLSSVSDPLIAFMKYYKNNVPIGTQKSSTEIVNEYLAINCD
jgi:hypothetical protein